MRFGLTPIDEAEGALLVHSVKLSGSTLKKGHHVAPEDVEALRAGGVREVWAAHLDADDVHEDDAANALATPLTGPGIRRAEAFTGRANLFARDAGILVLDESRLTAANRVHESLTIATLPNFARVKERQMLATVKVIPLAAPRAALDEAVAALSGETPPFRLHPFCARRIGLVATELPSVKEAMLDKTRRILDERVEAMGSAIASEIRCAHEATAIAESLHRQLTAGLSPLLVFGASATVDRRDAVPAGIEAAGGEITHFGMPVDPGNLMLLGRIGESPVVGLPGCARSPKLNGFDWVLERLLADIEVTPEQIMSMGVGGLLKEIESRPQPREGRAMPEAPKIAAIVLAAGQSRRMGAENKLTADIEGKPMLAHALEAVAASAADRVVIVTGHDERAVRKVAEATLGGGRATFVQNPDYADGLSTSLKAGLKALPDGIAGALVCLGDMPDLTREALDRLIAAFDPEEGRAICVPTVAGKRGNPVLWGAEFFGEMLELEGDVGAKHLIGLHGDRVCEVAMPDRAVLDDIDTPEALAHRRERTRAPDA